MASDINKFHFRLVLLGSNETGKTSILNRFLFKKFEEKYKPTVEDLFSKQFDLGIIELKVDFLDTSGSMQFPAMRRLSITTGDAFLIAYALDDENSYEVLKLCMAEIQEIRPDFQEIPIVFVGNKCDLPREKRKVPKELVSNYVYYELPRLRAKVIECSCRDNINIDNIFRAYLSLARVSLSTTVTIQNNHQNQHQHSSSLTSKRRRPNSTIPGEICSDISCSTQKEAKPNVGSHNGSPPNNESRSCAASIKEALGVRKSCDASMVSSMRKISISNTNSSRSSREQLLESMCEFERSQQDRTEVRQPTRQQQPQLVAAPTNNNDKNNDNNNNNTNIDSADQFAESGIKSAGTRDASIESLLRDAIQQQMGSKLSANNQQHLNQQAGLGGAKPRSRSLIWRPYRKSSRSTQNDTSECRVT